MRPTLFLAIQSAKRYRKKHNMPDYMEMPEGYEKEQFERNANMDLDCTTLDSKLLQGLELEHVALKDCGGWHIRAEKNPKDKVLYYIHGGGFVAGCTRGSFRFISYAVRHFGYDMFSVDYRLAPNAKYTHLSETLHGAPGVYLCGFRRPRSRRRGPLR